MFSLEGRIALVTGASRGLGAGIARSLAAAGADVVVNYARSVSKAEAVAEEIRAMGRRAVAVQADVGNEGDVRRLMETTQSELGRVDILVCNAGTTIAEDIFEVSLDSWRHIIDTNLTSTFLCAKYALEIMRENRWGRIIIISSMVGHNGALYGHVHYAATKSGQLGFTKTLARTAAKFSVTVNAIAPGIIRD